MSARAFLIGIGVAVGLAGAAGGAGPVAAQGAFALTSAQLEDSAFIANEQVFGGFGCTGGNISPALAWEGAPAGTKSFALTVYDPDAPTGSGFWHWLVINIPADAKGLDKGAGGEGGSLPAGALQTRTDFGAPGYGGPCPPQGDHAHRYFISLHALDVESLEGVGAEASPAFVGFNLHFHTLAKATLMGLYKR